MRVSIHNPFAGPIRAEVLGVKRGEQAPGVFAGPIWVTVRSVCEAKGYPKGYVFDAMYLDVYLNHKFVGYGVEYTGKPSIEELEAA